MSRKHFELIAKVFRGRKPNDAGPKFGQWLHIVLAMADELAAANPNFDRSRFLAASGVEFVN